MKLNQREQDAVDYCLSLGLDPHEMVPGWYNGVRWMFPRAGGYLGARVGQ